MTALGSADCDLMQPGAGEGAIAEHKPEIIVNAAAYTAVDKAESARDAAVRLNAQAPAELAKAAKKVDARFIHISTDYVFNGETDAPYNETAQVAPCNVYGASKRDGETAVLGLANEPVILRTSWVFSEYGANFVKTMLRLGAERDNLPIVDDQIGGPTPARDIARAILAIAAKLDRGAPGAGVYHYQGAPAVSWASFAEAIFDIAGLNVVIEKIPSSEFATPAPRPLRTVLDCARIERDFGVAPPDWRLGLRQVIGALNASPEP